MNKYLIDTNIFIESAYRFYAFDICPGFWEFLNKCARLDSVKSIDKVYKEITSDNPKLQDFKEQLNNRRFFLSIENISLEFYAEVSQALQTRSRLFSRSTCLSRILHYRNARSQKRQ